MHRVVMAFFTMVCCVALPSTSRLISSKSLFSLNRSELPTVDKYQGGASVHVCTAGVLTTL